MTNSLSTIIKQFQFVGTTLVQHKVDSTGFDKNPPWIVFQLIVLAQSIGVAASLPDTNLVSNPP